MKLTVFYHAWKDGEWGRPYREFVNAALGAGLGCLTVNWSHAGSEAPTLNLVRKYAERYDGAVLYAHTKGASNPEAFRDRWRRSMTNRLVSNWRENLTLLDDHDAVGCHWLTEAQFPGMFHPAMTVPASGSGFFGGNFWMARCDYLRTLPECEAQPRWKAEEWIGTNRPRVMDLLPGWPHDNRWPELCA